MRVIVLVTLILICLSGCGKIFDSSLDGQQTICPSAHVYAYQFAPRDSLFMYVSVTTYTSGELLIGDMNGNLFSSGFKMREGQTHYLNLRLGSTLWYRYHRCNLERDVAIQQILF